jgi:hypothetical protein
VYPLVLAPVFGLFSLDTAGVVAKVLNLLCAAAAAGLVAAHAVRARLLGARVPWWLPAVVVGAATAAVPVLTTQSVLFAEPLFALLLALTVACADRAGEGSSRGWAIAAGCAAALTLLTRTIGVAAGIGAVAFVGWTAWRDGRAATAAEGGVPAGRSRTPISHAVAAAVPLAVAVTVWLAWTIVHRRGIDPALAINYGSYGEVLRQTGLGALGSSAVDLPRPLFAITLGWLPRPVAIPLELAALAIGLYGLWLLLRRSSIAITLLGYLAILAIWPFPPDRFLWAVLPWLALIWVAGVVALLAHRWLRVPAAAVTLAAVVGFALYEFRNLPGRGWDRQAAAIGANFAELLPALRELPPDAVLAVDNESLVSLYTGRQAVPLFLYGYAGGRETRPTPAEQRAYLDRQHVTHVVLASASSPSAGELRALIAAYPGWLEPVHSWPGGRWIFAVRP